jgi:hypothetical protein
MSCITLLQGVNPNCAALKKVGGVGKRAWIGFLSDLESVVFAGTGINRVIQFTFKAGRGFVQYIGKKDKNSGTISIEVSDNATLRNQSMILMLFYNTPEELGTIDNLIDQDGVFGIFETKAGQLEVYGLNKGSNFQDFGLKASALEGGTGTLLTDNSAKTLTLSGLHQNMELLYQGADTAAAITGLTSANPGVITMASTAGYEIGDVITFEGLNGNQTIGGSPVNGQSATVLSKTGTTLTINAIVVGVTPATTGNISKVKDLADNVAAINAQTVWPTEPV